MSPHALIANARTEGVTLSLDPAGTLKATGEQSAVNRWLPTVRAHKAAIAAALVAVDPEPPEVAVESPADTEAERPLRRWLIVLQDGSRFSASYSPPQTRTEVLAWHPTAVSLEPEGDDEPLVERGADIPADIVVCCTCRHWRRDTIGDGSGLGTCAVSAPASREPGSLWPRSQHRCKVHSEVPS